MSSLSSTQNNYTMNQKERDFCNSWRRAKNPDVVDTPAAETKSTDDLTLDTVITVNSETAEPSTKQGKITMTMETRKSTCNDFGACCFGIWCTPVGFGVIYGIIAVGLIVTGSVLISRSGEAEKGDRSLTYIKINETSYVGTIQCRNQEQLQVSHITCPPDVVTCNGILVTLQKRQQCVIDDGKKCQTCEHTETKLVNWSILMIIIGALMIIIPVCANAK